MKIRFKRISFIYSISFLLISVTIFFFLHREIQVKIATTRQAEVDFQNEAIKRNEIKTLNNYFKSIEKEKALFETHFVQGSDVVSFLNTLENLAKSVGTVAEVDSISIGNNQDNKGLFVEIRDIGTFGEVYRFLTLLENSPYELEFISVDLHKFIPPDESSLKKESLTWEAILKLKLISFI